MVVKRVLCRHRLRRVPSHFSWIDHRLVRDRHICRCSAPALALYLFLVTVGDADGVSYYSDGSVSTLLSMDPVVLARARQDLVVASLVAYEKPFYQVLSLEEAPTSTPRSSSRGPAPLGQLLFDMMGGRT